jgi:hypothetical protein
MKESTLSKITASVAVAKGMAQRALATSPNPQWTEYEMRSIDEWIARQGVKLDRSEAIRRLVELGLKATIKTYRSRPTPTLDYAKYCHHGIVDADIAPKLQHIIEAVQCDPPANQT